jgi:alpha-1,6-mannosyltransferase
MLITVGVQWWRARDGGAEAARRAGIALLAVAILAPPTLPWYLTWGLAVLGASPWRNRWLAVSAGITVVILMVYYPDGEEAMGNPLHMVIVILLALLTTASMLWPDPLRLRRRPTKPVTDLDPIAAEETLAVRLPIVKEPADAVPSSLQESAMSVEHVVGAAEMPSDLAPQ